MSDENTSEGTELPQPVEAMTRAEAKERLNVEYARTGPDYVDAAVERHVHDYVAPEYVCACGEAYNGWTPPVEGASGSADVPGEVYSDTDSAADPGCVDVANNFEYGYAQGFEQGDTPNIVIESPRIRKIVNTTLAIIALVLACVSAFDATADYIDLSQYLVSAWSVYGVIAAAFGLTVVNSNIPKRKPTNAA